MLMTGRFGGDVFLRRLTKPNDEKNALLYLIDYVDCKYVIPCNRKDRFFFFFRYDYYILVVEPLNLW